MSLTAIYLFSTALSGVGSQGQQFEPISLNPAHLQIVRGGTPKLLQARCETVPPACSGSSSWAPLKSTCPKHLHSKLCKQINGLIIIRRQFVNKNGEKITGKVKPLKCLMPLKEMFVKK